MLMYKIVLNDELYHHGIKGQKWGVQNGPPYPLKAGDHSSKEQKYLKKADKAKKKEVKLTKQLANVKAKELKYSQKARKFANKASAGTMEDVLSDPNVQACALLAVAYIASFGIAKLANKAMEKHSDKELDKMYEKRDINSLAEAPKLKKPMSAKESMKVVNPGFPNPGTTSNCMLCTTAMAMREKGYDVIANTIDHGLWDSNLEKMWTSGGKFTKIKAKKSMDIIDTLNKEGDGAYGNLTVTWALGGGHSIFWKNEGGKTHIYDGQTGEEYDVSSERTSKLLANIYPGGSTYARYDNAEPNEKILAALCKRK